MMMERSVLCRFLTALFVAALTGVALPQTATKRPADRAAKTSNEKIESKTKVKANKPSTKQAVMAEARNGPTREQLLATIDSLSSDRRIAVAVLRGEFLVKPEGQNASFRFVLVPPGVFSFGYDDADLTRLRQDLNVAFAGFQSTPQVQINVVKGFFILDQEVTVEQFQASGARTARGDDQSGARAIDNAKSPQASPEEVHLPIVNVSWTDATRFCCWLGRETGLDIRLPTEIEWEYAARGPWPRRHPWYEPAPGSGTFPAWVGQGESGRPRMLDRATNGDLSWRRIFDMGGNVSEWCLDEYRQDYHKTLATSFPYDPTAVPLPPKSPDKYPRRTYRGGNFADDKLLCDLPLRRALNENKSSATIGFRPVAIVRTHP